MPPVIEAKGLVKRYGDFTAVSRIDFAVEEGECFGLLGSNGAGKTSTIRMISCVSPVSEGELRVDGHDVSTEGRVIKALLGVVPQEDNLDEDLDVLQNLLVHARYFGIRSDEARRRASEALEFMELTDRAGSPIDELSGGMKRRLMIARALINRPRVLMLDEPTTGLDPHGRHLVWERLHLLKSQGTTMVLSTHYMEEATHLCDRLAIMELGSILAEGPPRELVADRFGEEVVELRVAPWEKEKALALVAGRVEQVADHGDALVLIGADGHVPDLVRGLDSAVVLRRPPNLEDVFLVLTGKGLLSE